MKEYQKYTNDNENSEYINSSSKNDFVDLVLQVKHFGLFKSQFYHYGDIGFSWSSEAKNNDLIYNLQINHQNSECKVTPYYNGLTIRAVKN